MRLFELKTPVAMKSSFGLAVLKEIGVLRPRYGPAEFVLSGLYDDCLFYDSTGGVYETENILLLRPRFLDRIGQLACYIFVAMPNQKADFARVETRVRLREKLTLEQFCADIRDFTLSHRNWWYDHMTEREVEVMFEGCRTFEDAMGRIIRLDGPGEPRTPSIGSTKVIDERPTRKKTWF